MTLCTWCASDRGKEGTKLCDGCWEIKHRVEGATPMIKKRILDTLNMPDIAHAFDAGWKAGFSYANATIKGEADE